VEFLFPRIIIELDAIRGTYDEIQMG